MWANGAAGAEAGAQRGEPALGAAVGGVGFAASSAPPGAELPPRTESLCRSACRELL